MDIHQEEALDWEQDSAFLSYVAGYGMLLQPGQRFFSHTASLWAEVVMAEIRQDTENQHIDFEIIYKIRKHEPED